MNEDPVNHNLGMVGWVVIEELRRSAPSICFFTCNIKHFSLKVSCYSYELYANCTVETGWSCSVGAGVGVGGKCPLKMNKK